MVDKTILKV